MKRVENMNENMMLVDESMSTDVCDMTCGDVCDMACGDICDMECGDICETGSTDICEMDMVETNDEGQQIFEVQTEDGVIRRATLTVVVEIDGKEYAVYKMLDDDGSVSTYASYVVQDEDGYDVLKDIDNPKDKSKITAFVRKNGY